LDGFGGDWLGGVALGIGRFDSAEPSEITRAVLSDIDEAVGRFPGSAGRSYDGILSSNGIPLGQYDSGILRSWRLSGIDQTF
jgi:hypothetical protein